MLHTLNVKGSDALIIAIHIMFTEVSEKLSNNLPNELKKVYGHMDMGIYLYPLNNGKISVNDEINIS